MLRLYLTEHSYPELRDVRSWRRRHRIWWMAFVSAFRDRRFLVFGAIQVLLLGMHVVAGAWVLGLLEPVAFPIGVRLLIFVVTLVAWGATNLSIGGDLIRPHLRRVAEEARAACPSCGYRLAPVAPDGAHDVRCSECGDDIPGAIFTEPYAIPRRYRAFRRRPPGRTGRCARS